MSALDVPEIDSAVQKVLQERGITELMHFTTGKGVLGVLAQRAVKARTHLTQDSYLEHIYQPNSNFRRESPEYWRYVNLSISDVNRAFFRTSRGWWKSDEARFWAVLSFQPEPAAHPGVLFAQTNMAYGTVPRSGAEGCERLFASTVDIGFGKSLARSPEAPPNVPTYAQAEVLYPDALSTDYLQRIYVAEDEDAAKVEGYLAAIDHEPTPVVVSPTHFGL